MHRFKYKAINNKGRPIRGILAAATEGDLSRQLQQSGLELVQASVIGQGGGFSLPVGRKKVKTRDLIQLFTHLEQMQSAGVPMLDSLADIRDTTENAVLKDIMTEIFREVSEGTSLSEAMNQHPKVFHNLYVSLVKAGEETGDLPFTFRELLKYLKWIDDMQSKVRKATRYPTILLIAVIGTITVMMGYVVPQIVDFIKNMDQELPWYTISLMKTSEFFRVYWYIVVGLPILLFTIYKMLRRTSADFAFFMDSLWLKMPVAGNLIRKVSIARFCQTFGALFAAGIDVVGALKASRNTVTNLALGEALESVISYVQAGSPLSQALNLSGEFPSLVVRMVKIGEESGKLTPVLDQVSEFYTKDVDEAVQGMITSIEPTLTSILGLIILWIAAGVFGPIYDMMAKMNI
jgi:type IV pilus assembly protein PilC